MRGPSRGTQSLALALVLLGVARAPAAAEAPHPHGAPGPRLRVMVDEDPPFVMRDGERWTGWSIDMWTELANQAGLEWDVAGEGNPEAVVDAIAAGRADVGLGDISVTRNRLERVDFTHPFLHVGVRMLVPNERSASIVDALGLLATPVHGGILAGVLALLIAMSVLVYALARRHDLPTFPAARRERMAEAVYVATEALVKGTLDRQLLPGVAGRVLSILWMVFGTIAVAYVTAATAAALTVQHLASTIQDVRDLTGKRVAAVSGYQTVTWLARHGIGVVEAPDVDAAIDALTARRVDVVVHREPVLAWWLVHHPGASVAMVGRTFDQRDCAMAVAKGSPLRARLDLALLTLQDSGFFEELDRRWLGGAGEASATAAGPRDG